MMNMIATASIAGSVPFAAVAMPAPASQDPILAAIERHRRAYLVLLEAKVVRFHIIDSPRSPDYDAEAVEKADADQDSAYRKAYDAAMTLAGLRPTSLAGLLALLTYVDEFNAGLLVSKADPDFKSSMAEWPEVRAAECGGIDRFPHLILANARYALAAIGKRGRFERIESSSPSADPIYAKIEKHRAAEEELDRSCHRYGEFEKRYFDLCKRQGAEAQAKAAKAALRRDSKRHEKVTDRESAAFDALWEARPMTAAGFDTWLVYLQTMGADQRIGLLLNDGALADFIQKVRLGASL